MDDEFYDRCYEAWCCGKNPDNLSYDRWDHYRADGFYPDEITLNMMYPRDYPDEENY